MTNYIKEINRKRLQVGQDKMLHLFDREFNQGLSEKMIFE